jgi:hypothetical protein
MYRQLKKPPRARVAERTVQFTVRHVPVQVEKALKRKASIAGKSLNGVLLEALSRGAGIEQEILFDDLDRLAGRWQDDPEFDEAIRAQHQIDESLWK